MTIVADLVETTRRHLYGATLPQTNRLSGATLASATTLTMEFDIEDSGISSRSILAIGDELFRVLSVNEAAKQVTVEPGYLGSTEAAHSNGDLVEIDPLFTRFDIKQELKAEIKSWPSQLYAIASVNLTSATDKRSYDLAGVTTSVVRVLDVSMAAGTADTSALPTRFNWRIERDPGKTRFASGYGVSLVTPHPIPGSRTLTVVYAKPFDLDPFDDATDVETDIGLTGGMPDIAPYGAAWRLLASREARRAGTEDQPQRRRAEEVPPMHITNAARGMERVRDKLIAAEIERLSAGQAWRSL